MTSLSTNNDDDVIITSASSKTKNCEKHHNHHQPSSSVSASPSYPEFSPPQSPPPKYPSTSSSSSSLSLPRSKSSSKSSVQVEIEVPSVEDFLEDGEKDGGGSKKPDPWDVMIEEDDTVKWKDLTTNGKVLRVLWIILRILMILMALYFFICSLDVLQDAFQMLSGRSASQLFQNSILVNNPVSAAMIGVFVTVLVQSSSTSTSIIVSMVASNILTVEQSIPIIMGANIGTTVTNTLVALTQSPDRDVFRRSFAGATVHDAFNWLTVIVLLPLECASHYLLKLTEVMTSNIAPIDNANSGPKFLKVITDPLTKLIIQVDKKVITAIAEKSDRQKFPLAKYWEKEVSEHKKLNMSIENGMIEWKKANESVFTYNIKYDKDLSTNTSYLNFTRVLESNSTKAKHIFVGAGLEGYINEVASGVILLIASLLAMTFCLVLLVKVLNSLFKGPMTGVIRRSLNADLPGKCSYFTGYIVMVVGMLITILFQSSSVFTSALTPLVGMGLITVERVYPLTLGSNIGTTVTAMLAAFTADSERLRYTVQIALCHLFFNISGILLYFPIPFMRIPIPIAKELGNITAKYRWFALLYLFGMFGILPLFVFGLSLAGPEVFMGIGIPLLILLAFIIIVNVLQRKKPNWLPKFLRTWNFLPKPLRSLEPYDRIFSKCKCCDKLSSKSGQPQKTGAENDVSIDDESVVVEVAKDDKKVIDEKMNGDNQNCYCNDVVKTKRKLSLSKEDGEGMINSAFITISNDNLVDGDDSCYQTVL